MAKDKIHALDQGRRHLLIAARRAPELGGSPGVSIGTITSFPLERSMNKFIAATAITLFAVSASYAQQAGSHGSARILNTLPNDSGTVTNYYKQNVYDPSDNKIGEVADVLVSNDGRVEALIIAVGGFLGAGEKDVAVPFSAVKGTKKNDKWYLVMNTTKDALKSAPGFKYDSSKTQWVPESKS
jgi:sporulation protein YlmC with PRC-barrel domain